MALSATAQTVPAPSSGADRLKPVRIWLYVMAFLVLCMVVVGGATRLTESGLSITEWAPIAGTIPPLSDADWAREFEAYKQIPQGVQNSWMGIEDFKSIFWWEWGHRFLGRFLGVAFAVPFVIFLFQRRFSWKLAGPLAGLFLLGGLQGAIGWWMVSSGLSQLTSVSQYRMTYNTWPLMDGALIPKGLDVIDPFWKNLFENALTVQFNHRMIAYGVVAFVGLLLWRQAKRGGFGGAHGWMPRIGALVGLQVVLGILTLVNSVPISLALGHQALAFMLAGATMAYLADTSPQK